MSPQESTRQVIRQTSSLSVGKKNPSMTKNPADTDAPLDGVLRDAGPRTEVAVRRCSSLFHSLAVFFEMVKISHSIFALPFALSAGFIAARGSPPLLLLVKVVLACVLARTAAMAFNRLIDAELDGRNPRTARRAIPAGLISRSRVATITFLSAGLFVLTAAWINPLALALSPLALLVLLGYSYTKRFTQVSHLVLGLALGLAPLGAWVAVRGELALLPSVLGLAVLFWTAGFDVIYACQDVNFDSEEGLHSIPRRWGVRRALWIARLFHLLTGVLLVATGTLGGLGPIYFGGVIAVVLLLLYEHTLVRESDLSRVNVAFFTLNGLVSLAFMAATIADTLL
jgi:4-hydroxybenzoate polyprenyltransferase